MADKVKVSINTYFDEMYKRMPEVVKIDPRVSIKLNGLDYSLEFDNRAAIDILKDTGLNILTTPITLDKLRDPEFLGHIMHRGLQRHHPELGLDGANQFNIRHLRYILDKVLEAVKLILPDMDDMYVDPEEIAGSSTGGKVEDPI